MSQTPLSRAALFEAMKLGPVWELRSNAAAPAAPVAPVVSAAPAVRPEGLDGLAEQVASCTACGLCSTRRQTVFADGVPGARLMVVGEAPGADEDEQGFPFVGRAGQLLDKMLHAVGHNRSQNVYIGNVLKCRPPGNRNPEPEEISACLPFLHQQIQLASPQVLLLVGRFAIQSLLQTDAAVGQLRGKIHEARVGALSIPAVVTYHPAYLLRRPEEKQKAWDDLLLLKSVLK
ncbi:MAG: uracil-DNA glycosylase family protein [Limnobacter sp.]|uniref:uracil-DNA glycosylase n=1 Tax=Limnobacter sp. TaxID=2003368 RepID=UPI00391B0C87